MDEILTRIDKVVEAIVDISPTVWGIYYKQQIIIGMIGMLAFAVSLTSLFYGIYILKTRPKWALNSCGENIPGQSILIIGGVFTFALFIITVIDYLPRLLNPAYYAIQALIPM